MATAKQMFKNNASATLAVSINGTDGTIQVQSGYGALFPSPSAGRWAYVTLEDSAGNVEIVKCTARSGDLLTVTRGQDGTSGQSFTNTTTRVECRNTAGSMERFIQRDGDTMSGELDFAGNSIIGAVIDATSTIPQSVIYTVGQIMLWYGSLGALPTGWARCDGSNGTPDLRDVFIVGAGSTYAYGASGGAASATSDSQGAHDHGGATGTHALTEAEMPAHTHQLYGYSNPIGASGSYSIFTLDWTGPSASYSTNGPGGHQMVKSTGSGDAHSHTVTSGGAHTHSVATLPPYKALYYIMYTG